MVAIGILLLAAFACLAGCTTTGGNPHTTSFLFVSDSGNNRVLIYDTPFSTGESANVVLGQADFTTGTSGLTAATLNQPANTAEDRVGNIYVADTLNNRVLQFQPPFSNGMSASLVIGQPDFVTGTPNTTQNGLGASSGVIVGAVGLAFSRGGTLGRPAPLAAAVGGFVGGPVGVAFDSSGNLWVADFGNSRILQYQPPFATDMNASLVLGQADFTSSTAATTNSGLRGPESIAFDRSGNLWLTDTYNNRVLEFQPPFANGMAASLVIGQADFVSSAAATTASGLDFPTGIAFDSAGNLWIGDTDNSRVLQFAPPFANGMSASLALGQASFTTSTPATTQNGLSRPFGLTFDSSGNLGVADFANNRTLAFAPPFSTNQNASLVVGQADFTTAAAATTATGQTMPFAVSAAFSKQALFPF
ncbi:MAG: NHL repeat-containing protein [Terriglobales bacterium]